MLKIVKELFEAFMEGYDEDESVSKNNHVDYPEFKRKPKTIKDWQKESYRVATEKGWHNPSKTFSECMLLIHAELSEAVEEYRRSVPLNKVYVWSAENSGLNAIEEYDPSIHRDQKPEGIPIELADVAIRLFDMCEQFDIDLEEAIKIKHEYNKTRPERHGGKKI